MQGNKLIQKVIRVLKDNGDCVGHSYLLRYSRAKASEFSDVTRGQLADTLAILTKTHKVTVVDPTTGGQS
jgi:hypothetical protein